MAGQCGQSAVVLPVTVAEAAVSAWRTAHDESARAGMPAHITVLYPFLEPELVTDEVLAELRGLCAATTIGAVVFRRTIRLGDALALDPEPVGEIAQLTLAIARRWPEALPYGGRFDEVIPHLTVAVSRDGLLLDSIEAELHGRLPISATLRDAWLYTADGGQWTAEAQLPLGGA